MLITFGSIAMILTLGVDTLPDLNEAVTAGNYTIDSGGKGQTNHWLPCAPGRTKSRLWVKSAMMKCLTIS
ncbi:MAG: hypothetical protein LRZ85_07980 [Alphaproteobacteria bacterium]|nr:hypothetical protein [Alphaproteobacteria bacterium]